MNFHAILHKKANDFLELLQYCFLGGVGVGRLFTFPSNCPAKIDRDPIIWIHGIRSDKDSPATQHRYNKYARCPLNVHHLLIIILTLKLIMSQTSWTHLIRFIAEEDGQTHLGNIDAKKYPDVGLSMFNGDTVEAQLVTGSAFSGTVTSKIMHVKQVSILWHSLL